MQILIFGSCNVDYVYSMDHIVRIGETISADGLKIFPGGKGLNQAIATARAGAHAYFAGVIGKEGEMLAEIMQSSGVDLKHVRYTEQKNGHAIIQVSEKAENSIFIYPGSNGMVTCEYVDEVLENFCTGDFIVLQNEISNVDYIINKAYEKGMRIVLNPSPFNRAMRDVDLNKISFLLVNELEAEELSGFSDYEKSMYYFKKNYPNLSVVITLGKDGCVYIDRECEARQSAFLVDAKDTTAAGDTFTGYFVSELAAGGTVKGALKIASAASAISVSRMGAAPSIPLRQEVEESLLTLVPSKSYGKITTVGDKVLQYMDSNLSTASLRELSHILGYSTVYLGALCKKIFGATFAKILQDKRCAEATNLLINTDLSVAEISHTVGYSNQTFFRNVFKERYGKTPLNYRRDFRDND